MKLQFNTHHNMQHRILTINIRVSLLIEHSVQCFVRYFSNRICSHHEQDAHLLLASIHIG